MLDKTKYDNLKGEEFEEYIRSVINDALNGQTLYQAYRRNNERPFEIIEYIINDIIVEYVEKDLFIRGFVNVKNRVYGDVTEWYSCYGGTLSQLLFCGNHWEVKTDKIDIEEKYAFQKEWLHIDIIKHFEGFMLGIIGFDKIKSIVVDSVNKFMNDRLYGQFEGLVDCADKKFCMTGNGDSEIFNLCSMIEDYCCQEVVIFGTKEALEKIDGSVFNEYGAAMLLHPQHIEEPYSLDNKLIVLPYDIDAIKFDLTGDTRTTIMYTANEFDDLNIKIMVKTCVGSGVFAADGYGVFTFSE